MAAALLQASGSAAARGDPRHAGFGTASAAKQKCPVFRRVTEDGE
jgi:hypothetical protein